MDGSNAAILFDTLPGSRRGAPISAGILYVEDFDAEPAVLKTTAAEPAPVPDPVFTAAELDAAREAGRQEGFQASLADATLLQAQLQSAALQSLADGIAAARTSLDSVADAHAADLARTLLGVLRAVLPATMRAHAAAEVDAVLQALAPGLRAEPELRVRTHPDHADMLREALVALTAEDSCVLSVTTDLNLAPGDVKIAWQDGYARRDTAAIWTQVQAALAPLNLPTLKELCHGVGC